MNTARVYSCFLVLGVIIFSGGNWPQWRGPKGTGLSEEKKLPVKWGPKENIKWKAELPGPGNSSPIVWNNRVFVSCAVERGVKRLLLCFDRADGKELWRREVAYDQEEPTHDTNPFCSASPVTDGERVIVWHGSAGLYCYDFAGKELWKKDLGKFDHIWGNASSPVLYKDLVILNAGPGMQCFLAAYDKRTGDERWRVEPPGAKSVKVDEFRGAWSTPVLIEEKGKPQLIVNLPERLSAYDPENGAELWYCRGLSKLQYTSPLVGDELIVAMSGYHGPAMAVKRGGTGDVTDTHRVWLKSDKIPQRVGSGVFVGNRIYILHDSGVCWCIDAANGDTVWEQRLAGTWSSMTLADGKIYAPTTGGGMYVIQPNDLECKVVAENKLDEMQRASPAFSDGQIFLRTYKGLYCVEEGK